MRYMNDFDIDRAARRYGDHPVLGPAVETLTNLVEWTNENSDGWAYWPKPCRSAAKLMELIEGNGRASEYGWLITRDHLAEQSGPPSAVGTCGPSDLSDAMERDLKNGAGRTFRLYDDDGELYVTGRIVDTTADENGNGDWDFAPLDDYGMGAMGAVEIRYRDRATGKWRSL
jgi:hypothetical protein